MNTRGLVGLLVAVLAIVAGAGESARFMGFNIWGDYFDNPVGEREAGVLATIRRQNPDLLALQEITPGWWRSGLFPSLERDGYGIVKGDSKVTNYVPLAYRKARYALVESGFEPFHLRLDKSKGVTWAVLRDRRTGQGLLAFCTHFWWKSNGKESDAIRELDARLVVARLNELKRRHPYAAIGGGDLNACPGSWAYDLLTSEGYRTAAEVADEASSLSTHHGDPERDAQGVYRGTQRKTNNTPATSIDHVFVETNGVHALRHNVATDQQALDVSDHSPVVVDFTVL